MQIKFLVAVAVATLLVSSACGGGTPAAEPTSTPTPARPTPTVAPMATPTAVPTVAPTATTAPTPTAAQSQSAGKASTGAGEFANVARALAAAQSFRLKIELIEKGSNVRSELMTFESVRPDRQHIILGMGAQSIEAIKIGSDTFIKMGGQWTRSTGAGISTLGFDPEQVLSDINSGTEKGYTINKGGIVGVDGTRCQVWSITGPKLENSGTLYVGVEDNLPRQWKSAEVKLPSFTGGQEFVGTMIWTFSDWNGPIAINPPSL